MRRILSFCSLCLGLSAAPATAQCSSAPASFTTACTQLQGYLNSFDATINAQWNGSKSPVAFGAELTSADCNRGLQTLISPATINSVQLQLDGLASLGLQSVTIAVGFPILYQPFYQYNNDPQDYAKVLSFYQSVLAEVRKRGMKTVIETSVMFPTFATDLPLNAYYGTLSSSQVTAGRAQVAQTIAQTLQPDWLNLGSEPDTQAALLGLKTEYTPQQYAAEISTIVNQLRGAGISGKPLIGAGTGTWQTNAAGYIQALNGTALDYIDLHIYTANLGFLADAAQYFDLARASGKGIALSEAWMRKLTDSQLQGKSDFGIESVLSSTTTTSMDTFSFWAPLDSQFIGELVKLAYWKKLYYMSPFPCQFFFAYLDYSQTTNLTPDQINAQEIMAATAALHAGAQTATGQSYAAAIKPSVAAPVTVSAASGLAPVAPGSIVSIYGTNLATAATSATMLPLPTNLGGVSVTIGNTPLPLFYVSPQQINADIPDSVNTGPAVLTISTPSGPLTSSVTLVAVAPGLISANGDGKGVAAAQVVTAHSDGSQTSILPFQCPGGAGTCVPVPINLGPASDQSALVLYGTGIRNSIALSDVTVKIGTQTFSASYAGAAPTYVGLDQVNVFLPHALAGTGNVNVTVSVAGTLSNVVTLTFQ
ncbi:MAG TPA: IPT/TIG domain-containing protein [Bryobacteraceae bacterium]|nr:IPT/TIG domain-containing protein [Bryobacteraceae bacterium]